MKQFPIFLNLENRPVLVVGDDNAVVAKIRLLCAAGAKVTVISADPTSEIIDWAIGGALELHRRKFSATDLHEKAIVIASRAYGDVVAPAAQAAGILLNIIDGPEQSDFTVPAIIDREPVTVAVASNGLAPALARNLRQSLDAALPERLEDLADFAANFRETVSRLITDGSARRQFWNDVLDGDIADAVLAGNSAQANQLLITKLNAGATASPPELRVAEVIVDPDDLESLTRSELRKLRQAEAVLHDADTPERVLAFARRDAKQVALQSLDAEQRSLADIARAHGIESGLVVALRQCRRVETASALAITKA